MQRTARKTVCAFLVLASLSSSAFAAATDKAPPAKTGKPEHLLSFPERPLQPLMAVSPPAGLEIQASLPAPEILANRSTIRLIGFDLASASDRPEVVRSGPRLQCVTYARMLTGLNLFGDAGTWWNQARGLYDLLTAPKAGAVMVFAGTGRMRHGHVAVVKEVVSSREVRVDHANWGNDGKVYLNAPVIDVSPNNDWSLVKVWNAKTDELGTHAYPVKGFVAE